MIMMKFLGALVIVLAASMLGMQRANLLAARVKQLSRLRSALAVLETEIGYGMRPLSQACLDIASGKSDVISVIFRSISDKLLHSEDFSTFECFQKVIDEEWPNTALANSEKQILLELGRILGSTDCKDQLKHIALAIAKLKQEEEGATVEHSSFGKVYKSLGFLLGLLVVILIF